MSDTAELKRWHAELNTIFDRLVALPMAGFPDGASSDTIHAVGFAAGVVAKAKALLGRDIDDGGRKEQPDVDPTLQRSGFR